MRWADRTIDPVVITEDRDAWERHGDAEWRLGPYRIRCTVVNGVRNYRACFCPIGFIPEQSKWFSGPDAPAEARRWCVMDAKLEQVMEYCAASSPDEPPAVEVAQETPRAHRDELRDEAIKAAKASLGRNYANR